MKRLASQLIVLSVVVVCLPAKARCEPGVTVDEILELWAARQEQLTTLQLNWTEVYFMSQGSEFGRDLRDKNDAGDSFPAKDTLITRNVTLVYDRDRWRLETNGPEWWSMKEAIVDTHKVELYDAEKYIVYSGTSQLDDDCHRTGIIYSKGPKRRPRNITKDPRIWAPYNLFRPLHPVIGSFAERKWILSRTMSTVAGRDCVVMERVGKPNSPVFERVFLDPGRGYVILRRTLGVGKDVLVKIDVEHVAHPRVGWVPKSWDVVLNCPDAPGRIASIYNAHVASCKVNEPVNNSWYEFEFPPHTEVLDKRNEKTVSYIVKSPAEKRIITDAERHREAGRNDFLPTESGEARKNAVVHDSRWLIFSSGAVVIIALSICWWVRHRRAGKHS